jgi:hypothetical protein
MRTLSSHRQPVHTAEDDVEYLMTTIGTRQGSAYSAVDKNTSRIPQKNKINLVSDLCEKDVWNTCVSKTFMHTINPLKHGFLTGVARNFSML